MFLISISVLVANQIFISPSSPSSDDDTESDALDQKPLLTLGCIALVKILTSILQYAPCLISNAVLCGNLGAPAGKFSVAATCYTDSYLS